MYRANGIRITKGVTGLGALTTTLLNKSSNEWSPDKLKEILTDLYN